MAIDGYTNKRNGVPVPDVKWWMEQIDLGEKFRKKVAYEDQWDTWYKYYRGDWREGVLPVNLFFTMVRSIVPRIYFRNPSVSVSPAKPDPMNMALAQVMERMDNKLIRMMKIKTEMKQMVQDCFFCGTCIGKLGYGSFFAPTPELDSTEDPLDKSGNKLEYLQGVKRDMPWFKRVNPRDFVVPAGATSLRESRWVAHRIVRSVEDVKADPRLKNTKDIGFITYPSPGFRQDRIQRKAKDVVLYEVRDNKTGMVFVLAKDHDKPLYFDFDEFQINNGFPFYTANFNPDSEFFWGVSDAKILDPYQREVNETRTQIMKHRRAALVKLIATRDRIDQAEAEKIFSDTGNGIVWETQPGAIRPAQIGDIPQALFASLNQTHEDVRETIGFSRNQLGEYNPKSRDVTATEASIVQQASDIRIDERRDEMADIIMNMINDLNFFLAANWTEEEVVDVIGPTGARIWVSFKPQMLAEARFELNVDPDSAVPVTKAGREQRALGVYQMFQNNPLVDPNILTRWTMHEMNIPSLDYAQRYLIPGEGGQQSVIPMTLEDYATMIRESYEKGGQGNAAV